MNDTIADKFKGEFRTVLITEVSPNDWNPKESVEENEENMRRYEQIKNNIATKSLYEPIKVRSLGPNTYQIVDGFHRWKACKELGYTKIMVWDFGTITKEEAQGITMDSIYLNIPASEPLTAQVVAAINLTNPEALKLLPFSELEIKDYLDLAEFDFNKFKDENPGKGTDTNSENEKMVECPKCHHKFTINLWANITESPTEEPMTDPDQTVGTTENPEDKIVN